MNLDRHPRRTPCLEIEEVGDGFIVYQPERDRIHYLNHTAAMLFELASGELSVGEIASMMAMAYSLSLPPHEDVTKGLDQLVAEGLVLWPNDGTAGII